MSAIRVVIVGILALLLGLAPEVAKAENTVVVLPLADYSPANTLSTARQQAEAVTALLNKRLAEKGLGVVSGGTVFSSLVSSKCIHPLDYSHDIHPDTTTKNLENELNDQWSDWMKKELKTLITAEQKRMMPGLADQDNHLAVPTTKVLDSDQVVALSRQFGAQYVLRGRLLTYNLKGEFPNPPLRRAILPIFGSVDHTDRYAVATATSYDNLDDLMVAGFFDTNDENRRVLRLQLWVQDADTGGVVWHNIKVVPWNWYNSTSKKDTAMDQAVTALINDFWDSVHVDSDGDGVFDHRDRCADTPAGITVDRFGCPMDTDGDGVPDYLDSCPGSAAGAPVDQHGCIQDADRDGIADQLDDCPNTPVKIAVDAKGCPKDTDGDGVPDHKDKCAETPAGRQVDNNGCPKPLKKTVSMELQIRFDFDKTVIKPAFHDHLQKVGQFLKTYPEVSAEIAGHSDHEGTREYNLKLSLRRADAVKKYLIDHFDIVPSRLTTKGYGESQPVAKNTTAKGRAMNRRAVAIFSTTINK